MYWSRFVLLKLSYPRPVQPRTEEGVENLFEKQERMVAYGPVFCDITWGAGGTTADVTLDIAANMQNQTCIDTMMHLTCTNMPIEKLDDALKAVQKLGIQNILALRGKTSTTTSS